MTQEIVLNALFGVIIGFVGGYAGIGGAPFLVFLLGLTLGYSQHEAQGTVVAIMLGPMSLPGVWVMRDRVRPHITAIAIAVVTYAIFSYAGASLAYQFSSRTLKLFFAALLLGLGLRYLLKARSAAGRDDSILDRAGLPPAEVTTPAELSGEPAPEREAHGEARTEAQSDTQSDTQSESPRGLIPMNALSMTLLGCAIGVVGGMFGIGAGVLMVPLLCWLFALPKNDARAISLAILLPPVSIGAALRYHQQGDVRWLPAIVGFVAYFLTNYQGAKVGRTSSSKSFDGVMGVVLVLTALIYAARA